MRWLFWLLLLVNVGIFAFFQWGGLLTTANNSMQNQPGFNVEKIKLLDASAVLQIPPTVPAPLPLTLSTVELSAASAVSPNSATSVVLATQPVAQPMQPIIQPVSAFTPTQSVNQASSIPSTQIVAPLSTPPATQPPIPIPLLTPATQTKTVSKQCMEWGEFSGVERNRANAALDKLKLSEGLVQRQTNATNSYWVHVPPLKSKATANQKVVRFKKAGVRDIYVVQDPGRWQYAISLGLFKTEEAAHRYHAELRRKGIQSAVVSELANNIKITTFILKNLDKESAAKVRKLHKDFFGSELKTIACN
ncbi:MAG: SPOR domain-containing protein [Candidatus Nitrotoga sp.]